MTLGVSEAGQLVVRESTRVYGLAGMLNDRRAGDIAAVLLPDGRGTIARLVLTDGSPLQPLRFPGSATISHFYEHNGIFKLRLAARDEHGHMAKSELACEAVAVFDRSARVKKVWDEFLGHLEPGLVHHLESLCPDMLVPMAPYRDIDVLVDGHKPQRVILGGITFWRDIVELVPWKPFTAVPGQPMCKTLKHEVGQLPHRFMVQCGTSHTVPATIRFR
jgi:hypothetical protein